MKTQWTKGLNAQKKLEITQDFKASGALRERLTLLLTEKIASRRGRAITEEAYASPSWALLQADATGYERALHEAISLLSSNEV